MNDGERVREADVYPVELVERECVVLEALTVDDHLQLPLHQFGRQPIGLVQTSAIECGEFGKAASGQVAPACRPRIGLRCQLSFERLLFCA